MMANFVVATFHSAQRMADIVRRHSPESDIALDGYELSQLGRLKYFRHFENGNTRLMPFTPLMEEP
jgi:hypothetical protein